LSLVDIIFRSYIFRRSIFRRRYI